jgi:multidrug efflux system membrane fusion protein
VLVAPVERRDVPIYLEGLGNVAAYYTVTVRSQVDGRVDQVLFTEGQAVHRGDVLAQVDPRPFLAQVHQAEGVLTRDRAALRAGRRLLERDQALREGRLIAPQDYDTQLGVVEQAEGALAADQAQLENARLQLTYARITAPIDGVTGVRLVDPGNIVHASDATGIVVITQIDPIAVFFTLPEDDLPKVAQQMAHGPLQVEVFSRDGLTQLGTGQLALIDNQINQNTATIRLKSIFANPRRLLWPDQFVKVRMLLTTRRGALVVPAAAIQRGPQGTLVYVVGSGQRAASRAVQVDHTEGDLALIAGGLSAGERVVTDGQSRLRPGARVAPRTADQRSETRVVGPP